MILSSFSHRPTDRRKKTLSMVVSAEVISKASDLTPCRYQEPTQNIQWKPAFDMGLFIEIVWCIFFIFVKYMRQYFDGLSQRPMSSPPGRSPSDATVGRLPYPWSSPYPGPGHYNYHPSQHYYRTWFHNYKQQWHQQWQRFSGAQHQYNEKLSSLFGKFPRCKLKVLVNSELNSLNNACKLFILSLYLNDIPKT